MTTAKWIAETIHDTIDESATAIEGIHHSIAELPLDIFSAIKPFEETLAEVRDVQTRSIKGVYGIVRQVNDRIGEIASEVLRESD
jgi:hypothetical protein